MHLLKSCQCICENTIIRMYEMAFSVNLYITFFWRWEGKYVGRFSIDHLVRPFWSRDPKESHYQTLFEVKFPYDPVCPSIGWSVRRLMVFHHFCHNFLKGREVSLPWSFTTMKFHFHAPIGALVNITIIIYKPPESYFIL